MRVISVLNEAVNSYGSPETHTNRILFRWCVYLCYQIYIPSLLASVQVDPRDSSPIGVPSIYPARGLVGHMKHENGM